MGNNASTSFDSGAPIENLADKKLEIERALFSEMEITGRYYILNIHKELKCLYYLFCANKYLKSSIRLLSNFRFTCCIAEEYERSGNSLICKIFQKTSYGTNKIWSIWRRANNRT